VVKAIEAYRTDKSALPKVLHPLCGRSMLGWVIEQALGLEPERIVLVVGHGADEVAQHGRKLAGDVPFEVRVQEPQLGTGHALQVAADAIPSDAQRVVVLYGDMPLLRGVEWLDPSTPIYVEDLLAWEEFAGVTISSGDALFVRTGRWAMRDAEGPWQYGQAGAGLHASVLPFLRERDVAILIGDAVNDVQPSGVEGINRPIHQLTQVNLGLPIVDNGYMKDVAETAARLQRWEFMTSIQINPIKGGTASPFNALATF